MNLFDKDQLKAISECMLREGQTISVAESVTSGLLQFALSNAPDAARFFQGGVTAYNIAQKYKFLAVEPIHALAVNCVSERVAKEMALNGAKIFRSDWGIGITGYATPVPESGNLLYAYYAIAFDGEIREAARHEADTDDPPAVQLHFARHVLARLKDLMD